MFSFSSHIGSSLLVLVCFNSSPLCYLSSVYRAFILTALYPLAMHIFWRIRCQSFKISCTWKIRHDKQMNKLISVSYKVRTVFVSRMFNLNFPVVRTSQCLTHYLRYLAGMQEYLLVKCGSSHSTLQNIIELGQQYPIVVCSTRAIQEPSKTPRPIHRPQRKTPAQETFIPPVHAAAFRSSTLSIFF